MARAELGGTVSVQSEGRFRGIDYSNRHPQGQLTLTYDGESGWYGGGLLTRAHFVGQRRSGQLQAFAGRVFSLQPDLNAEAGVTASRFDSLQQYDYAEVYAGLLGEGWSTRLYYASDYFGSRQRSLYAELNLSWFRTTSAQVFSHIGVLHGSGGPYRNPQGPSRLDLRMGVAWRPGAVELQLAWVAVSRGGPYTRAADARQQALILGLSAAF